MTDHTDQDFPIYAAVMAPRRFWQRPVIKILAPVYVNGWKIPAGFESDGATTPRVLWPAIHPWGKWFKAAILHDYLLTQGDREHADYEFHQALIWCGVRKPLAWLMWLAVRVYGEVSRHKSK